MKKTVLVLAILLGLFGLSATGCGCCDNNDECSSCR
jgi:hypothetical protein